MKIVILHYAEGLVREAMLAYWRRELGWPYLLALAAMAVFCFYGFWTGNPTWLTGAAAAVLIMGCAAAVMLYIMPYRNAMSRLRGMSQPQASLEMTDETFRIVSDLGSSELS